LHVESDNTDCRFIVLTNSILFLLMLYKEHSLCVVLKKMRNGETFINKMAIMVILQPSLKGSEV
jgi:hypothetical protein